MNEEIKLHEVKGYYQGTTNITHLSLVYSLKNRKFIKGYVDGSSAHGCIHYRLFPGRYIWIGYDYWSKADPPSKIEVTLFSIEEDGKKKDLKSVYIQFYNYEFLTQFPPQIMDVFHARPGYHRKPSLHTLFSKQYSEQDHERLINLLNSSKNYKEGEEHE